MRFETIWSDLDLNIQDLDIFSQESQISVMCTMFSAGTLNREFRLIKLENNEISSKTRTFD